MAHQLMGGCFGYGSPCLRLEGPATQREMLSKTVLRVRRLLRIRSSSRLGLSAHSRTMSSQVKFYELWNPKDGKGIGAAAALKKAQEFVRGREKWKHPYYWAAWVLWGLPN